MPSNGSIALWCVPRTGSAPTEIEAHFNYWRLSGDKSYKKRQATSNFADFVEIGVFVVDIKQIDSICIYMPGRVDRDVIKDCSPFLEKAAFAQGIFNDVITITPPAPGGAPCVVLHDQTGAIFTRVHCFASDTSGIDSSELSLAPQHDGTVLTILPAAIQDACVHAAPPSPTYFRLRIYLKDPTIQSSFVKVIQPLDQWLQSGYNEIEYIDFRMNEARTLPAGIERRMRADRDRGGAVDFRVVAFLTAVPVHSELSCSNTPSHKMRLLEPIWDEYVESGIPKGMVVYHWKKVPEATVAISDFSAFVKLETRRTSRRILITYLAIAFAIGLVGNWSAEFISDNFKSAFNKQPHAACPQGTRPAGHSQLTSKSLPASTATPPPAPSEPETSSDSTAVGGKPLNAVGGNQ